jgi:hypothetical protein
MEVVMENKVSKPEAENEGAEESPEIYAVSQEGREVKFTRKEFLDLAAAGAGALALSGCTSGVSEVFQEISTSIAPSNTPRPTKTPTRKPTPTKTRTPRPTGTKRASPTPALQATVKGDTVNVRSGPGKTFSILAVLNGGDLVNILGRLEDNSWFHIETADGILGWMAASVLEVLVDLETIPIISDIPPTPTPRPPEGKPGEVQPGQTGINYKLEGKTYSLPCGSPLPAGAVCICNCVTVPGGGGCSCDKVCTCDTVCSCVGASHYWYPN